MSVILSPECGKHCEEVLLGCPPDRCSRRDSTSLILVVVTRILDQ